MSVGCGAGASGLDGDGSGWQVQSRRHARWMQEQVVALAIIPAEHAAPSASLTCPQFVQESEGYEPASSQQARDPPAPAAPANLRNPTAGGVGVGKCGPAGLWRLLDCVLLPCSWCSAVCKAG